MMLKSIKDQKVLKVLRNTAKVIYSWGRKALIFQNSKFCEELIYKYELIHLK